MIVVDATGQGGGVDAHAGRWHAADCQEYRQGYEPSQQALQRLTGHQRDGGMEQVS